MLLLLQVTTDFSNLTKTKRAVSHAEIIYGAVCIMVAVSKGGGVPLVDDWVSGVHACGGAPTSSLRTSGCEPQGFSLADMAMGGCGIGRDLSEGSLVIPIALACAELAGGDGRGFSASRVMNYMTAHKGKKIPAPHHSGKGGSRLNTVGAAKMVAQFIEQNRGKIAVAISYARDGGGGGTTTTSSSSSSSSSSSRSISNSSTSSSANAAQKAVAAAAKAKAAQGARAASARTSSPPRPRQSPSTARSAQNYCHKHKLWWHRCNTEDESYLSCCLISVNANFPSIITSWAEFNNAVN